MENKRNEMLYITTYADDTGLFSERECDFDNTTTLEVPIWIVEEWYKAYISEEEITFYDWINEECTCDDFIGFYNFCIIKGIVPHINASEIDDKVFYLDDDDNKHVVFEGTYNECRRFGKMQNWSYLEYDLQLEIE